MLTTNTTNSSNRPPPPGSLPSNNQPPKKAKTGSSSITSFFSRASVNPNFAALQNAAQTAPSSPAGSSTAQIPSGRNAINRNGHGGKRANSGRKRKQPEIAKDVSSDSEPETPQPPEPSQLETIHTNPLTIITNKPTVETMKDARARLGWNELSDTSDSSDDDMCSLASDSEDEEHQQTLPFFVDDDEPDLSLQDLVVNAVDPDSIPSVQLSVTNPDDDMPAPQTNNIPIQRKRVSEFIGQSPTDKYLQLCLNALNKTYDVHKDDSVSLLEKNTYGRKVKDLRERIMTGLKDGHSIIYPPRPEVVLRRNLELGLAPSPDPFCVPPVRFFESHISSSVLPCCNNNVCEFNGKNEKMSFRGWSSRPRRLFGTSDKLMYYLFTARYKCGACAKEWYGTTTEMMKSLPHEVQLSFEVLLSQRSGVDLEIVEDIGIDIKMGPTAARDKYAEKARKRHTKLQLSYYSTIESFLRQRKSQPSANVSAFKFLFNADGTLQMNNITKFPNFFDPYYGGEIMSADWLLKMFKDLMSSRRSYMDGEVQRRFSSNGIYSLDHTFRTLHGIGLQNGQRPVAATFNLRNDNGEIRINDLLPSAGHSAMEVPLISLKTTMDAAGIGHPEIAFTDKCCSDSDFLLRIFPSLSSHVKDMDFASIPSSVETVSYGRDNLTALGLKCTSLLEFAKRSRIFMSVDCEWDTLNNRKVGKVPVITFAVNHPKPFVAFINLDPSQPFPLELKALLQNKNVTKVGSHIFHDARHLLADYGVELVEAECVRLEKLCKTNNWSPSAKIGMKKMAEKVLGIKMRKDEGIRSGKWTKKSHTKEEIMYAIEDAYFGLMIYEKAKFPRPNAEFTAESPQLTPTFPTSQLDSDIDMSPEASSPEAVYEVVKRVLLDTFHALFRVEKQVPSPKKHPASSAFMKAFRDAVFLINPEDKARVEAVLKEHFDGMTFDEMFEQNPDWILKRIRRLVPLPTVLKARLEALLVTFQDEAFVYDGVPVLNDAAVKEMRSLIDSHVVKGCLSDPPGISFYRLVGKDKYGLPIYICLRGSSALESFHQTSNRSLQMWACSLEYYDILRAVLLHRFNIRASERYRPGFPKTGHYDHFLFDQINEVTKRLFGESVLTWWTIPAIRPITTETFGVVPCLPPNQLHNFTADFVKQYPPLQRYLAVRQKLKVPYTTVSTVEEMGLFKKHIPEYYGKGRRGIKAVDDGDWVTMAEDWNSGKLKDVTGRMDSPLPGYSTNVWCKFPEALAAFFNTYDRARKKRLMLDANRDPLSLMRDAINQHPAMTVQFLGAVAAKPLGYLDFSVEEEEQDIDFPFFVSHLSVQRSDPQAQPTLPTTSNFVQTSSPRLSAFRTSQVPAPNMIRSVTAVFTAPVPLGPLPQKKKDRTCVNCRISTCPGKNNRSRCQAGSGSSSMPRDILPKALGSGQQ